ncbi:MAG: ABC transporter substrate-binding protein [Paludibacterium sp.]|uniref:ABC transporter substrate-binding protein n=1 Tax=Paludibacterium sp. TaxID=1917523 RepID=UPI0025E0C915|nr:ABC transporter substrate-binding protein [Paludibacterium sp.]MBV8049428.1 ABC transporter substrate-binding protein [Paludibacterium sp.]MBV8649668.1 ABC transporter substrate-binding protein [Paludibacterium sp.]
MRDAKKALLAAGLLAAASYASAAGTLIYCSEGSPAGFDPGQYTAGTDFDASAETVFNRLVQFQRGATKVIPGLATKWDVSADGLSYTFHLRSGVKFHTTDTFKPTRDFNADDVVFTFDRMLNKDNAFRKAYPTDFPYFSDMGMPDNIVKVEKVDPMTVRFQLKSVDASFLADLAMSFASIQSAEYADKLLKDGHPELINSQPVGTGPFIFKRYQKDAQIRFAANKQYWDKAEGPKVDNLIFAITTDPSVRYQKLKAGECQVAAYPRPADVALMKADPKLHVLTQSGFNVGYLGYNVLHKPLNNLQVRQALDMAINKSAILTAVYQGQGQPAVNPMPPTQWSYNKSVKDAPFNPTKAKALLAKAGFPNGMDINLWAMPVQRPYNPNAKLMAEMIQSDWAKIGVRAKIVTYEWGEYLKRAKGGEHDAILVGWTGDNGDPDNWLNALLGCEAVNGNNYTKWCYKPFDDLIQKGKRTTNVAERTKLYSQAQVIAKQQLPLTTIAHSTVNEPTTKNVVGFKVSPFGLNSFYGVSVK